MHDDEVRATADQVSQLLRQQCPRWSGLPVVALADDVEGTDHVLFRVGDEIVARMPKVGWAADQVESDARWLPVVAPHLPVRVPVPIFVGEPGADFPWRWSLVPWIPGTTPPRLGCDDVSLAADLAAFARALHSVEVDGGPLKPPGTRGSALVHADPAVREAVSRLVEHDDGFDVVAAQTAWDICLKAPQWGGPPVWIHGDLQPGNLIVRDGRLAGVVDFGAFGVGDPAPDVAPALWTFTGEARTAYREAMDYDDATWLRACGWALGPSLTGIDYYRHTFPRMAEHGRQMVRAVVAELS
jgi:aminoglycoside phosphotransferase (APT) family kinase protein